MVRKLLLFCTTLVMLLMAGNSFGQIYLSGYARDSTTFDLLPYTTIHTVKGAPVAAANENGYFTFAINPGDTVVFTRLGYKPVKVAPKETAWDMNVMLPETVRVLDQVVVYDRYIIHGHEQIQQAIKEGAAADNPKFRNQTVEAPNANTMIQTFGAGMVMNGVLSKLLGTDRERRKMTTNKAELVKTQVYYEVIQSMQVKEYLMGQLGIDEDQYFKSLEKFKVDYPTAVYLVSRQEIIRLMVESFARK
ncbi:MAG TPA: hypothetical protein VFE50_19055 [Cyclobacteriaceae bacterium]|nr:hypothetical protein [Cyclobacteriaceae bacterium]